jgi:ABC-type uncharacterized transport system permease subunit
MLLSLKKGSISSLHGTLIGLTYSWNLLLTTTRQKMCMNVVMETTTMMMIANVESG